MADRPLVPAVSHPLSGNESFFILQGGRIRRIEFEDLQEIVALHAEQINTTVGSTVTFKVPFQSPPIVIPLATWSGVQRYEATVVSVSETRITVGGKRTRGNLLYSSTPYEDAPSGSPVALVIIGKQVLS